MIVALKAQNLKYCHHLEMIREKGVLMMADVASDGMESAIIRLWFTNNRLPAVPDCEKHLALIRA